MRVRGSAGPVLAGHSAALQASARYHVALGVCALREAAAPTRERDPAGTALAESPLLRPRDGTGLRAKLLLGSFPLPWTQGRRREGGSLGRGRTAYPATPPRLAACPGPEGPLRPRSAPAREVVYKPSPALHARDPPALPTYLASACAPGQRRLCPLHPARHAPGAPPAAGCAQPSPVRPCVG